MILLIALNNMSIFLNPLYKERLTYTSPAPTQTEVQAVVDELFKKIALRFHIENIQCKFLTGNGSVGIRIYPPKSQTISDHLYKLASTGPGIELFQRLNRVLSNASSINISNKENVNQTTFANRGITYDPHQIRYYVSRNSAGETIILPKPSEITLAHELIHILHIYEDERGYRERSCTLPAMATMTHAEELLTIAGFGNGLTPVPKTEGSKIRANIKVVDRVCENSFLFAFGLPPRISHTGIYGPYTFQHLVKLNAIGTLKEILVSNPTFATTKIGSEYPYEIAQRYGRLEMANLLRIA